MNIGTLVFRCRWVIVSIWVIAAGLLIYLVPAVDPSIDERTTFLPSDTPHSLAVEAFGKSFPQNSGLSEAVIVFERRDKPLTSEDKAKIEEIAERIPRPVSPNTSAKDLEGITVLSPGLILLPQNPLISKVSRNGQGALINVNIPANFITLRSARVVDHIRWILNAADLPEGLTAAVTGSSGFGRDYAAAAERSHRQTLLVTLVAVIVILLLVYRAPVAALIPLGAISLGAIVVMKLLGLAEHFGMHSGTAERIFVVVLLYGAGIDYSLLLISRYQENLNSSVAPPGAIAAALGRRFWRFWRLPERTPPDCSCSASRISGSFARRVRPSVLH